MPRPAPLAQLARLSSEPVLVHAPEGGDLCGRYVEANEPACRLLGYARSELLELGPRDLVAPGAAPFDAGDVARLAEGGVVQRALHLRRRDGHALDVEVRAALAADADGCDLVVSVLRDAAALGPGDARQQTLLALLDMAPDAILLGGERQEIVFWNKGAEATYGYSREEALGRIPRELLKTRDHSPPVRGSVGETLHAQGSWEGEVTHTRKDGREIRVASRWKVQRDAAGRLIGIIGINRDVTGHLRARDRLARLQHLEALGRLAAGVAHGFNNRLAVILACAEELRRALPADARELREVVEDLVAAGAASRDLVRELVALAGERSELRVPGEVDLNEVVRRCAAVLRTSLPPDIQLTVTLEPALWPARCDAHGVERALLRLAWNGRDAMPGGGRLTLASANVEVDEDLVTAHPFLQRGPHVRLTVADTGRGMSPDVQAHAFEPFFTTKPEGRGVGLGLAGAHGMVRQSGGHILLASAPERGTTFEVYFPRAADPGNAGDPGDSGAA